MGAAKPDKVSAKKKATTAVLTKNDLSKKVTAQNKTVEKLDEELKKQRFSGTALVVKNGQIKLSQGYGQADVLKDRKNQPKTTFPVASTAKILTAILIGQQVEKGKLSYDSPLQNYYPMVPNADQITVRDLLTMTSDLKQSKQPDQYTSEQDNVDFSAENTESSGGVLGTGSGWTYQPVNYRLLAGILMKVTGKSYQTLVNDLFNKKADLGILFYPDFKKTTAFAKAYTFGSETERDITPVEYQRETGTGNVSMTTGQLYLLYQKFFSDKLIKHHQSLLEQRLPAHYAAGLYGYGSVYEGHGIISGYESNVVLSHNGQDAVILLSNQYDSDHSFQKLGQQFFTELTGEQAP
ncbi:beta-lactamase family protein [Fructobacillus sp. M1-13]|uniref:Serine hydrolase n=1 Tax=Fructobacillus papyriferae TaxID=2713171 RepID=A0ABS5QQD2_9LACO|nr:serine hydrolase [Fructobacillus papyriferae]MBS9335379.1 serine hydrolase [Fructobacillus papyriferae]MCD2158951.1 beta-lactamase family protein [Fructobacillus papyriferae]